MSNNYEKLHERFSITSVCKADLESVGFDTKDTGDSKMQHLASKMADSYCDRSFWDDLKIHAEFLGIKKRKKRNSTKV